MNRKNVEGARFGQLLALARLPYTQGSNAVYRCLCDCGQFVTIQMAKLTTGVRTTCGHDARDRLAEAATRHGLRFNPLYMRWAHIKERCENPNCKDYANYGGRGIVVCDRWQDVRNFITDMESTFVPGLTIERVEVNGPYSPGNCIWIPASEQAKNTRKTKHFSMRVHRARSAMNGQE